MIDISATRRSLLASLAGASTALAASLPAAAAGAGPADDAGLLAMEREAARQAAALQAIPGADEDRFGEAVDDLEALDQRICLSPAFSVAGLAVKLRRLLSVDMNLADGGPPLWLASALLVMLDDVERIGGPAVVRRDRAPSRVVTLAEIHAAEARGGGVMIAGRMTSDLAIEELRRALAAEARIEAEPEPATAEAVMRRRETLSDLRDLLLDLEQEASRWPASTPGGMAVQAAIALHQSLRVAQAFKRTGPDGLPGLDVVMMRTDDLLVRALEALLAGLERLAGAPLDSNAAERFLGGELDFSPDARVAEALAGADGNVPPPGRRAGLTDDG